MKDIVLFLTLPFRSHLYPTFGFAHSLQDDGYTVIYSGNKFSEDWIKTEGFIFEEMTYLIEDQISSFRTFLAVLLKSLSDKSFHKKRYQHLIKSKIVLQDILKKHKPIKIFLSANMAEYYLFFKEMNIDTEIINIYLPIQKRKGIPPLDSNFIPSGNYFSDFYCDFLWKKYFFKKNTKIYIEKICFLGFTDDYFLQKIYSKNRNNFKNIFSTASYFLKSINQLPYHFFCSQDLEFKNFKPYPNEIFHSNKRERIECINQNKEYSEIRSNLLRFRANNKKIIYLSFGTFAYGNKHVDTFIEKVIKICEENLTFILVISHYGEFKFTKSDRIWVLNWLPQLDILTFTDVMITHGGLGNYKECYDANVKMLVVPINTKLDQTGNAARIEANAYGKRTELEENETKIKEKLYKLLEL